MNGALRRPMTLEQFLAWEERQELRYEFDGFRPEAMVGGTFAHAVISRNLVALLTERLRGKPCQPIGSDLKILVAGHIRYPDAFVVCTEVPLEATVVSNPVIVFEVLSKSTAKKDLSVKNAEYSATPSVRRYVALEQTRISATYFSWIGGTWQGNTVASGESLPLPEFGCAILIDDIYAGIRFPVRSKRR